METCRHADRLIAALEAAHARNKPVIVLKIGATEQGGAAAASHTGALAGSDAVMDAVLRRHGALRVRSIEEMLDVGHAASLLLPSRLPHTDTATLVAASGGFGIMMADAMTIAGIRLPPLAAVTRARINEAVPTAGTNNPVDASAQMSSRPDILLKMLTALLDDPGGSTTVLFMSLSLFSSRLRAIYLDALAQVRQSHPERLLVIISHGPADAIAQINALGIPVFGSIDAAAHGVASLVRLGKLREQPAAPHYTGAFARIDPEVFRNEYRAKSALAAAGIDVPRESIAGSADEAVGFAESIGYPVVLKIVSEDIAHKTEVGGVALDLREADAVRAAHARLLDNACKHAPTARLDGVLVAPMLSGGVEMIAGISRDPVFGAVVMVGMGGIHAEILKDVAVQTAPVTEDEALQMIRSLRMFPLLDGARGQPKADLAAIARTVARLSEFACRHADGVAEIDLNPILVKPAGEGVVVLDALMIPSCTAPVTH
jgi:acyl-CoA synthetase (NDP forming)